MASSKPTLNKPGSRSHSQEDAPLVENLATTHITDERSREPRFSESEEIVVVDELGQGALNSTEHDPPYRMTSISSEDLLAGDGEEGGVGAELHPEDPDLEFALEESMDEQQFEVVDTVDPVESQTEGHSSLQQECTGKMFCTKLKTKLVSFPDPQYGTQNSGVLDRDENNVTSQGPYLIA